MKVSCNVVPGKVAPASKINEAGVTVRRGTLGRRSAGLPRLPTAEVRKAGRGSAVRSVTSVFQFSSRDPFRLETMPSAGAATSDVVQVESAEQMVGASDRYRDRYECGNPRTIRSKADSFQT